jgi:hypothetical protein
LPRERRLKVGAEHARLHLRRRPVENLRLRQVVGEHQRHLTETDGADLCKSVVAEMTPHYRPDEWKWTNFRDMEHFYVRVTGQLFFDGSHKPCSQGSALSGHPARATVWEIHPVYRFEICEYDECPGSFGGLLSCGPNTKCISDLHLIPMFYFFTSCGSNVRLRSRGTSIGTSP